MKTILGLFALALSAFCASAQVTVLDVQALAILATAAYTPAASITGTLGSKCTLVKTAGPTISAYWKCSSSDGKNTIGPGAIIAASPNIVALPLVTYAEIMCLVTVNPTATAAAAGVMLGVPAVGMAWQCSAGPGSTTLQAGSVTWP